MKTYFIKLTIFLISAIITFFVADFTDFILATLVSLSLFLILDYVENRNVSAVCFVLFIVACCIRSEFIFFIPLLMYSLFFSGYEALLLISLIPVIVNYESLDEKSLFISSIICILEFVLEGQLRNDRKRIELYKTQRDELAESADVLERKLNELADRQDAEVMIATLNERNRIAHEIHDNVGHLLSSSIIQIGAVMAVTDDEKVKVNLNNIKETLDKGMNSVRASIHNLHEDSLNLKESIDEIVKGFTFCDVKFNYDVRTDMPIRLRCTVIPIVKEALANVIKHSNATHVTVSVNEHPSIYQLIISDNGTKKNIDSKSGMGIEGMRLRVANFNGIMNIDTEMGFRIFISFPKEDGG